MRPGPEPKCKGRHTSEFWMSLACLAAGVVLVLTGHEEIGGTLIAVTGGYAVSRGLAKRPN